MNKFLLSLLLLSSNLYAINTETQITVVDWNSQTNVIHNGCNINYMVQLSSANATYLFTDCNQIPVYNKMPKYSERNIYSTKFVEIGINDLIVNELHEYYGCFRTSETTVIEGNSPNQYNLHSINMNVVTSNKTKPAYSRFHLTHTI